MAVLRSREVGGTEKREDGKNEKKMVRDVNLETIRKRER